MNLRQATLQDTDAVVDLVAAMLQDMASYGGHPLDEEDRVRSLLRTRFTDSLEKEDHVYVVALPRGRPEQPVGIVEASLVSPHGVFRPRLLVHVHALYVQPHCRRKGIGRGLLQEALNWGRANGCEEATLNVLARNPARDLYGSLGFEVAESEMRLKL